MAYTHAIVISCDWPLKMHYGFKVIELSAKWKCEVKTGQNPVHKSDATLPLFQKKIMAVLVVSIQNIGR